MNKVKYLIILFFSFYSSLSAQENIVKDTILHDSLDAKYSFQVTFSAASTQRFGFDKKEHVEWILNYEPIRLSDSTNYFVPWKSIGKGQTDVVEAHVDFAGFDPSRLSFKDKNGNALDHAGSGGTYTVTVPSDAQCVYAWYMDLKLGKLNVVELDTLSRRVVVVPVNGATMSAASLQSELNAIYAQANVSWTVSTAAPFSFDLGSDGLEAADATLFSKYSPEMRVLRDSFRTQDTAYDKNAYYLFIVPNFSDPAQLGYMVRGRAAGFLAAGANAREAAHELGHGAFGLEHTFPDPAQGATTNLMDYANGTQLHKKQWDAIHSNMPVFNWLDEEEDGSAFGMQCTHYACISDTAALSRINNYHVFYLPDGRIADLTGYTVTGFYTVEDLYSTARGSLYSIDYEEKNLVHLFNKDQQLTLGYGYKVSPEEGYTISIDDETIISQNSLEAVQVFVDEANHIIDIKRNGQIIETFAFDGICQCHSPQWLYFTENTAEQAYLSYYISSGSPTTEEIYNNTSIINQLVSLVNEEKYHSLKSEDLLGDALADKLRTYELFNNKKFIVVRAEVDVLDINQNNWQSLAEKVFEQAGLPDDAILITIPYVLGNDLGGAGHDVNMPGLAVGRNVNIQTTSLNNNYSHIQNSAERKAGSPTVVSQFIYDVFKWTNKKAVIYQGIYNASNAIECAKYESNNAVGLGFNKTIRLYKHDGYDYLKNVIDEKNAAEHSMHQAYATNPNPIQLAESIRNLEYEYSLVYAEVLSNVAVITTYSEFTPKSQNNIIYKEEFIESTYSGYDDNNAELYITNKAFRELQEELEFPVANDFDYYTSQTLNRDFFTDFVDPVVYKALDITSLIIGIMLPGSDILPDGLGLLYSVIRMNTEEQLVYTLAVSIGSGIGTGFVIRNTFSGAKKNVLKILKNNTVKEVDNITDDVLLSYVESQYTRGNFSNEVYLSLKNKRGQELKQGIEEVLGMTDDLTAGVISLEKLIGRSSSENIIWKNLDETHIIWANPNSNILSTAKTFANETGTTLYDAVLSNGFYVKFDLNDGRILLGKADGTYHAFAILNDVELSAFKTSVLNVSDNVFNTKLSQLLTSNAEKLKVLSGVVSKPVSIAGATVSFSTTKVNTILGKYNPDLQQIYNELGSFKNVGLGENIGGINMLNKPGFYDYISPEQWWNQWNKSWLERAVNRGDDIYLSTEVNYAKLWDATNSRPTTYAYEVRYLSQRGYKPVNLNSSEWENAQQIINQIFE